MSGSHVQGASVVSVTIQGRPARRSPVYEVSGRSGRKRQPSPASPREVRPSASPEPVQVAQVSTPDYEVTLGILMQRWPNPERPFGMLTPFGQTVTELAEAEGVRVLIFAPDDLDLEQERVRALHWTGPRSGWVAQEAGLPDVLWNRYFRKDREALLQALGRRGIPQVNEGALNKWEAFQRLEAAGGELRECLPRTELLTSARTIFDLLEGFPEVYLKPIAGSVGRGIIRASGEGPGAVRLAYVSAQTGDVREVYATEEQLERWLVSKGYSGRYIAQQGLPLTVFHGRPADVRVLVQKDGDGAWNVTGMGARVAAHGRFTANLHTGGQAVPVELLLEAVAPDDVARQRALLDKMERVALAAAGRLEAGVGALGELGLDLGIDLSGNVWYIEQNAQPGRAVFDHIGRRDLFELAHLRPVRYARQLATAKSARAASRQST